MAREKAAWERQLAASAAEVKAQKLARATANAAAGKAVAARMRAEGRVWGGVLVVGVTARGGA